MKKIIAFIIFLIVIGVGGTFVYFNWIKPLFDTMDTYATENADTVKNASFYLWDRNDAPIDYINASNYSFVIMPEDKILSNEINRNIVIDYTDKSDFSFSSLQSQKELSKKYGIIGVAIRSSFLNKNVSKLSSFCRKNYCIINYISQFLIYVDEPLSTETQNLITKRPDSFAIIVENYIQEELPSELDYLKTLSIPLFSVEKVIMYSSNDLDSAGIRTQIGSIVAKAKQNSIKYQLEIVQDSNPGTCYPHLSQLPEISANVSGTTVPIITWAITAPHNGFTQDQYSIAIANKQSDLSAFFENFPLEYNLDTTSAPKPLYTTKRQSSPYLQMDLLPETEVSGSQHYAAVQIWLDIVFPGLPPVNIMPIYPTSVEINFDFTAYQSQPAVSNFQKIAWIPDWGVERGVDALWADINKNGKATYTSVSPVWFEPSADGTLLYLGKVNDETLLSVCNTYDISIIPTITAIRDDSGDVISEILNNNMDKHIDEIVSLVVNNGYAGIDLDYEKTYIKDKELLLTFVERLHARLEEEGKVLSFTALSKWGDGVLYGYLVETRQAQDWQRLGANVDQLRIMVYDMRSSGSQTVGPAASYIWYLSVMNYAIENVPREKIIMGMPLYGYGWTLETTNQLDLDPLETGQEVLTALNELDPYGVKDLDSYISEGYPITLASIAKDPQYYGYYEVDDPWNFESLSITYSAYEYGNWSYNTYLSIDDLTKRIDTAYNAGLGGTVFWSLVEY